MRFGLVISIILHAIVIGLLVITIERSVPFLSEELDIPVEVVTVAEEANVKAATKEEEPAEEPPAPEPQVAPPQAAAPEPEPEPEAAPEPAPEEERRAEVRPQARPTPPKKPEKPKEDKFDLDAISVLIDKSRKAQEEQQTAEAAPSETPSEETRESIGAGDDMTITLVQLMQRQVEPCWNFPAGAVQPEKLDVYVTIYLRPDGTLSDPPVVENPGRMSDPYFRAAAEAAMRAINRCQPFDMPSEEYEVWKEVRLNFDPSRMIGL